MLVVFDSSALGTVAHLRGRGDLTQKLWLLGFFGIVIDRGTFWALPFTYFCLPKSAWAYLFPQSVKIHYFRSGPISLCTHGRLMGLRVHASIMGSRGYLVFRHAIIAQEDEGTLECSIRSIFKLRISKFGV